MPGDGRDESLPRTVVGLAALAVTFATAVGAGTLVFLRALIWLPDAAVDAGLVPSVTTPLVFASGVVGLVAAVTAMLACFYVGPAAFAAVERRIS